MIVDIPAYDGVGVYALRAPDGRVYIGSARNVQRRIKQHASYARSGYEIKALQAAHDAGIPLTASVLVYLPMETDAAALHDAEQKCLDAAKAAGAVYNAGRVIRWSKQNYLKAAARIAETVARDTAEK